MGPPPPPLNLGRLLAIGLGVAIFVTGSWLVVKSQQPDVPVIKVKPEPNSEEQPLAYYLARGDAARGQASFARCVGCHTIAQGAPHGVGPNLWGAMGNALASRPGFANYSDALRRVGGRWDWEPMNLFLRSPRHFAPGTRMTFGGMTNPQERADVMLYLNGQGGSLTPPATVPAGAR